MSLCCNESPFILDIGCLLSSQEQQYNVRGPGNMRGPTKVFMYMFQIILMRKRSPVRKWLILLHSKAICF